MRNTENKDKGRNAGGNFLNYILDQLSDVENFRFKKIFGGIDFYRNGYHFGTIRGGKFLLQADPECGQVSPPRTHFGEDSDTFDDTIFFEVPEDIIANKSILKSWAERAYQSAKKRLLIKQIKLLV
ncbi:MAG: TfoX/Sxy family protein [Saprospiraceae bacterium]|nr:TfoX/Sxy family protein [Saprospiraceae bacterium]